MRKKKDLILILSFLVLIALAFLIRFVLQKNSRDAGSGAPTLLKVTVMGEEYGEFDLDEDREIVISTGYGTNRICIDQGRVYMKEADCPDQYCVLHGALASTADSIVCLPHRLAAQLVPAPDDTEARSLPDEGKEVPDAISR